MKPNRRFFIGLLSVVFIVVLSACHPGNVFRSHFGNDAERSAHRIDYVVNKLTRTLDLDDGQQARLKDMAENLHSKMMEIRKDREEGKEEVIALISREKVEASEIDDFLVQKMERIKPVRRLFAESLAEFHTMLTPEQRERLAAEIRNHEPGRCRFGGKW